MKAEEIYKQAVSDVECYRSDFPNGALDQQWFGTAFECVDSDNWSYYWGACAQHDMERVTHILVVTHPDRDPVVACFDHEPSSSEISGAVGEQFRDRLPDWVEWYDASRGALVQSRGAGEWTVTRKPGGVTIYALQPA